jgi:ubiquitin carboxyl-terminal hydrolase 25
VPSVHSLCSPLLDNLLDMSGSTSPRPLPKPQIHSRKHSIDVEPSEKENLAPKPRRPLPTPGKDGHTPIPASSFYASKSDITAKSEGSSHTMFAPPQSPPPYHKIKETTPFREPELVDDEPVPPLIAPDSWGPVETTPWDSAWSGYWENGASKKVDIDGRNNEEECNWCDEAMREKYKRPGPGVLPPLLSHCLHNPEHTLYSVTATAPPLKNPTPSSSAPSSSPPSVASSSSLSHSVPPSADEIRTAVPHPNAYYCKEHNGWVLLYWCSSSVLPPIVPSYHFEHPLPDQTRRKRTSSCIGSEDQATGRANRTHHFHKYAAAVDARTLNIPFKRSEWEAEARQKRRNRSVTLRLEGNEGETSTKGEKAEGPEGDFLDLYVCCQCSIYCLVSRHVIPGVIPLRRVEEFVKDKTDNPPLGKTSAMAVVSGWETIITYVSNLHCRSVCLIMILPQYISLLPNLS